MPTSKKITDFVVNKVPTKSIFNKMKEKGLISDDEIYIVEEDDSAKPYVSYESQSLTDAQKSQARTNIGALSTTGTAASAVKLSTSRTIRTNLSSTSTASFNGTANIDPGVNGTLPIANGGTGATSATAARTNLGAAAASHTHKAGDITSGTLGLDRGGTGSSVSLRDAPNGAIIRKLKADSENSLWYTTTASGALYATSENGVPTFGTLPIAQGGTGATSAEDARSKLGAAASSHTHGAGDITGTLGIAHGGTGATTAADARNNLGAFSKSGGTLTGNLVIKKTSAPLNPFLKLQINDNTTTGIVQVYIPEGSSTQKMAVGFGSGKSIIVDDDGCLILTTAMYGTNLPAAGKKGRIFFKKV